MHLLSSTKNETWLPWFLRGILFLMGLVIIGRLIELQIVKGRYYRNLSDGNRVKRIALQAPRGRILARGGEVLAVSKPYDKVLEDGITIPGWIREYPLGSKASHVIGYLGEVNGGELGKVNPGCIEKGPRRLGSLTGRSGLEQEYNCLLSGIDGAELVEVDTKGSMVRVLGKINPVPGKDLKTSLNYPLQEKVAGMLDGKRGAIVATDVKGEVMAIYSSPSYDPVKTVEGLDDPNQPFFNRAVGGLYHPGSTFKILVALAGLEEKAIDENYYYEDKGVIELKTQFGDFSYSNWYFTQYGGVEGKINIVKALIRSCDTFFYNLGELLGIGKLVKWSEKLKLDKKTDIDIPGEAMGLIPTPIWKEKTKGEKWFLGNTYHMSIGQGDLAITPLSANTITSIVASGGKLCLPKIVGKPDCEDLRVKDENIEIIKKGLAGVCSPGGTGYPFFDFIADKGLPAGRQVACKTGTAETGKKDVTHAWFTTFAPVDLPEIVLTVLIEEGGEGSKVAGPIAREIMDFWFLKK